MKQLLTKRRRILLYAAAIIAAVALAGREGVDAETIGDWIEIGIGLATASGAGALALTHLRDDDTDQE